VPQYAIKSAFHDTRFIPITLEELPNLSVSLSILSDCQQIHDWHDWQIGVHGIRIHFTIENTHYSASYLPQVATQFSMRPSCFYLTSYVTLDWTHQETLYSLIHKAGFKDKKRYPDILKAMVIEKYTTESASMQYKDYQKIFQARLLNKENNSK
jgi:AMME syndrome candidate gene 1 protein